MCDCAIIIANKDGAKTMKEPDAGPRKMSPTEIRELYLDGYRIHSNGQHEVDPKHNQIVSWMCWIELRTTK